MKIASRYLLPVELITAVVLLSWGLSGWVGGSALWNMLEPHGMNTEWGLLLCGVGAAQLVAAASELFLGLHWRPRALFVSVTVRFWLAFFAMVVWLYACYAVLVLPGAPGVFSLAIQAPAMLVCSSWIAYGNRKVACVLDPTVPTHKLQAEILEKRRRGWSAEEDPFSSRGPL
jgi:hypothetical protein